jgi:galactokinase
MELNEKTLSGNFKQVFQIPEEPLIVRSPGRVNIIGEHTDYNDGFVLPAAINKSAWVAVTKRNDNIVSLYATDFNEAHETTLSAIVKTDKHWPNYILGIIDQLQKTNAALTGFNLLLAADIPIGAGLSSSAALECATVFALNELFHLQLSKAEMAHIAQHAEHEFAGVKCGVMDMFASLFGKKDHVINLDCRSLFYEYVPLKLSGFKILLLNTNVKHQLSSSAYNTRREQCEQGVAWVKEYVPGVKALRDVTVDMLDKYVLPKDKLIYQRCKYVVDEDNRLLQACTDLKKGDINALGAKMFATHDGLSREYEVSCKELDFLVDYVRNNKAVLGARMMGGGFGGCTINIIKEDAIAILVAALVPDYKMATGYDLSYYIASVEDGTQLVTKKEAAYVQPA